MGLAVGWVVDWTRGAASTMGEHLTELDALDTAIGDGDLGTALECGFRCASAALAAGTDKTPGGALRSVGRVLRDTVGGASGNLLAEAYLAAGGAVGERDVLEEPEIVEVLLAARRAIGERGHAVAGEKTMMDAWAPASDAALASFADGASTREIIQAAADAAERGAAATTALPGVRGRAGLLGARACGHADPGALASALLLREAARAADLAPVG